MNRSHYIAQGREAYARGRIIFMPNRQPTWQRAAFRHGYMKAREEWRAAHPHASESDAMTRRSRAFCRGMVKP